jgi:uncharacterized protein YodC (DUF2158 family)
MAGPFKLGDVVQRKTGGPEMAVTDASGASIRCMCFDQEKQDFDERQLDRDTLKPVRDPSQRRSQHFEVDDWVTFKLGSMAMRVTHMSPDAVSCSWYVQSTREDKKRDFPPALLKFDHSEPVDGDDLEAGLSEEGCND